MSETTDDAQRSASPEVGTTGGGPTPGTPLPPPETDDVEVVAQAESPEVPLRHDSVVPTSRKLAPPPKPKRDSGSPASLPPAAADPLAQVGSLRAPAPPSISFQEPPAQPEGASALRAISDALAQDAGAFSASESPTGGRPAVPRPRSQSSTDKDGLEEPPASVGPASTPIFAQRIISIGGSAPSKPAAPLAESERPELASAVPDHVETAQPPDVAPSAPAPAEAPPPAATSELLLPPPLVVETTVTMDIQVEVGPSELTAADIPITTEYEEEPTVPGAQVATRDAASPSPGPVAEASVATPPAAVVAAPSAVEDPGVDSAERLQVEELSREDSPSIPPDEPAPAAPPPVPAREAKPPPPPRRAPAPTREELTSPEAAPEVEKKKTSKQKRPWWEELFSEDFVRANWKVSDEQIKREVTFVEESLGVAPGGVVLDLGCGSGQHAVELASRGYGVVGYDLSLYQLALAADIAQERSQKLNFLQGDMREMAFEQMFDGIFCWNTSFGYFEEDKNFSVAERAFRALRPGGMFLVDVMNRDFVAAHTPSSVWFEGDSCVCMDDAVIDYFTSRLRVKRSVILDDGRTRECTYSVRLYSFHELGKLLHEVGFRVTEVSGHPATPGVFLGQASPRILMLAQRP